MLQHLGPSPQPSPIADDFARCIDSFKRFYFALAGDEQWLERISLVSVSDEYGRLGVWGGNMSANRRGRGSLDDSLRDDPETRSIVLEVLNNLLNDLESGTRLATSTDEAGDEPVTSPEEENSEAQSDAASISSMDSDSEVFADDDTESRIGKTAQMRRLISVLFDSIRYLYSISAMLKRPSIPAKYIRSGSKAIDSHLSHFASWDQRHAIEKMSQWACDIQQPYETPIDASYFLLQRIAAANTGRREQLKYWQKHPDFQGQEEKLPVPAPQPMEIKTEKSAADYVSLPPSTRASHTITPSAVPSAPSGPTVQSFSTVAITDINDNETFTGRPRTIYAQSQAGGRTARVPDAPKPIPGNQFIQCPYCLTEVNALSMQKRDLWKKHVFRDLRPYVCTFQDCLNPNKMFLTRHDWWYHEVQVHRRRWVCSVDCSETFKSKTDAEAHMRTKHSSAFTELQLPILIDMCERPEKPSQPTDCPLCPKTLPLSTLEAHIASHLEELALFVIPAVADDSSDAGGSHRAVGSVEELDRSDFDSLSSLDSFSSLGSVSKARHSESSIPGRQDALDFTILLEEEASPPAPHIQDWIEAERNSDSSLLRQDLRNAAAWVQNQKGRKCPAKTPETAPPLDGSEVYQCTIGCYAKFYTLDDWRKHEEATYPQEGWLCVLEPVVPNGMDDNGIVTICAYCGLNRPPPSHIFEKHSDITLCHQKSFGDPGKVHYSKRSFRQHFRDLHPAIPFEDHHGLSRFRIQSRFPRACGFCDHHFHHWGERISHIGAHFEEGKNMSEWRETRNQDRGSQQDLSMYAPEEKSNSIAAEAGSSPIETFSARSLLLEVRSQRIDEGDGSASFEPQRQADILRELDRLGLLSTNDTQPTSLLEENLSIFPCHNIPFSKYSHFIGRQKELGEVRKYLNSADGASEFRSLALCGTGGIGKTLTALYYAHERAENDTAAVLWLNCKTGLSLARSFYEVAVMLKLEGVATDENTDQNKFIVLKWLRNTSVSWLLVMDNVEDLNLARNAWPSTPHGKVLITARGVDVATIDPEMKVLEVEPLEDDGPSLLLRLIGRDSYSEPEKDAALELSTRLGGLPLFLTIMASQIRLRGISIAEFLPAYEQNAMPISEDLQDIETYHIYWQTAFESLSSEASAILEIIAHIAPDAIPEALFKPLDPSMLPEALRFCVDEWKFMNACEQLISSALIRRDPLTHMIYVHHLVQEACRHYIGKEKQQLCFNNASKLLCAAFPQFVNGRSLRNEWTACQLYIQHVLILCARYEEGQFQPKTSNEFDSFLSLSTASGWYLMECGAWEEELELMRTAMEICEDKDGLTWANLANSLGCTETERGHVASAHAYIERTLQIRQKLLPEDHEDIANSYNNYANIILLDLQPGACEKATDYYFRAIEIFSKAPEENKNKIPLHVPHTNISRAMRLLKRYDEAIKHANLSRSCAVAILGPGNHFDGLADYCIANVLFDQGKYDEAERLWTRALKIFSREKETHPSTSAAKLKLSTIAMKNGRFDEAIIALQKILIISQLNERSKGDKGETARITRKLAEAYQLKGETEKAAELKMEAEAMRKEIQGSRFDLLPDEDLSYAMMSFHAFW